MCFGLRVGWTFQDPATLSSIQCLSPLGFFVGRQVRRDEADQGPALQPDQQLPDHRAHREAGAGRETNGGCLVLLLLWPLNNLVSDLQQDWMSDVLNHHDDALLLFNLTADPGELLCIFHHCLMPWFFFQVRDLDIAQAGESHNVARSHPLVVRDLLRRLASHEER